MKTEHTKAIHPLTAYLGQAQSKQTFTGFDESRLHAGVMLIHIDSAMEAIARGEYGLVELVQRVHSDDRTLLFVSQCGPEFRGRLIQWMEAHLGIDYDYDAWLFTTPKMMSGDGLMVMNRTNAHMQMVDALVKLISPFVVGRIGQVPLGDLPPPANHPDTKLDTGFEYGSGAKLYRHVLVSQMRYGSFMAGIHWDDDDSSAAHLYDLVEHQGWREHRKAHVLLGIGESPLEALADLEVRIRARLANEAVEVVKTRVAGEYAELLDYRW